MSDQNVKSPAASSALQARLESPAPGQNIYDEAMFLSGWVYAPGRDPASCRLRAYLDDCCFAETRILFYRPDVGEKLGLSRGVLTGFRMLGKIQPAATEPREATLRIIASWDDEVSSTLAEQPVRLVPALLRERPYGEVVYPENETLLHRENIYGSGPPLEDPGIEVVNLLQEYLPDRSSVVDVGCGAGVYGPGLMAAGHNWLGLEANSHCCDILLRRQLSFRRVNLESRHLPCADGEWDCAVCIEVLEHVPDPEHTLSEMARCGESRLLVSVPREPLWRMLNMARGAYWGQLGNTPGHLNHWSKRSFVKLLSGYGHVVETRSPFPWTMLLVQT